MLHRGRIADKFTLHEVRSLERNDLARLKQVRPSGVTRHAGAIARLRDPHHNLARFIAMGKRQVEAGRLAGYSQARVGALMKSPAFQELVAHYRKMVDDSFKEDVDAFMELASSNMLTAERMIAERLEAADDEDGEPIPVKTLLSISRDAADRLGYGKQSTKLNVNVDFASKLERAIARSNNAKVIDGEATVAEPVRALRRI